AGRVDREQLTVLRRIASHGVGGGGEERPVPSGVHEQTKGVHPVKLRELKQIPSTEEEDLADHGVEEACRPDTMVHGLPVQGQCREARATPRDGEARNDLAARLRDRRRERSELRAIDLDGEGGQLALRIQALRIGEAVEPDRLVVEEPGEAGSRETRNGRGGVGEGRGPDPGTPPHGPRYQLGRPGRPAPPQIGEDDTPTVRAERESWEYIGIEADYTGPVRLELKARVAARRTKPTKPAAICSHEEESWLLWRRERQVEQGHVAALLEHHPLPI